MVSEIPRLVSPTSEESSPRLGLPAESPRVFPSRLVNNGEWFRHRPSGNPMAAFGRRKFRESWPSVALDRSNDRQCRDRILRRRFVEGLLPNVLPLPRKSIPKQDEPRRNINQTHNPKVEGSNPSPATT